MEIKTKTQKIVEVEEISNIFCNKCDKSIIYLYNNVAGTKLLADFGYGSVKDGLMEEFHLCDDCYDDLVLTFKHPPTKLHDG